ncbi:MAG: MOSC N-terminal beta barrel domain-containing protein [Pseudomonadota bacterium]
MNQYNLTIKQLFIYPVKSLAGIEVVDWPALNTGLKWDRQFMLIDEKGMFVTQRQLPDMVLIRPSIEDDELTFSYGNEQSITMPLSAEQKNSADIDARIWKDTCQTFEPEPSVSQWFTGILQRKVTLVALSKKRPQSSPERFGENTTTLFADAAPYLVINQKSLLALNDSLSHKALSSVDIRRFRPNIVVDGDMTAFDEHHYNKLLTENYSIELIDHCQRCIITTIDPDTGIKDPKLEPFKTVAEINPMPQNAKSPAFGVNATVTSRQENGVKLKVGDKLVAQTD